MPPTADSDVDDFTDSVLLRVEWARRHSKSFVAITGLLMTPPTKRRLEELGYTVEYDWSREQHNRRLLTNFYLVRWP